MLDNEKLLFDEIYEKTKDCGRVQFVELLMTKERENKDLKIQVSSREEVANKYKEVIDKAIKILDIIIYDLEEHEEALPPTKEELCKVFGILNEVVE